MQTHSRMLMILLAAVLVLLTACNSKTLTRSKAAEIISKQFPRPMNFNLATFPLKIPHVRSLFS
jgi:hypothetical protein